MEARERGEKNCVRLWEVKVGHGVGHKTVSDWEEEGDLCYGPKKKWEAGAH